MLSKVKWWYGAPKARKCSTLEDWFPKPSARKNAKGSDCQKPQGSRHDTDLILRRVLQLLSTWDPSSLNPMVVSYAARQQSLRCVLDGLVKKR